MTIAEDSLRAADAVVRNIYAAEDRLATFPELGELRPEFGADFRKWTVGKYLILYKIEPAAIAVVRILHGARDIPTVLDD